MLMMRIPATSRACFLVILAAILFHSPSVRCHGRLMEPPSRACVRNDSHNIPYNYNGERMTFGGFNTGKRDVESVATAATPERQPEGVGKHNNAAMVGKYIQGQTIQITIFLSANHTGYFEISLYPNNNLCTATLQECIDKHVIRRQGSTRFNVTTIQGGIYRLEFKLPAKVTCSHCLLEWTYNVGNIWGCENSGRCCIGCGHQVPFYGCADIAILPSITTEQPTQEN